MNKYDIYIGIDPGSNTGVSLWFTRTKELQVYQFMSHCEAMLFLYDRLRGFPNLKSKVKFRIEDARKAKARPDLAEINKGKIQGVGYVKAYSKDWEAFCVLKGYDYELLAPNNTKVSPAYFLGLTGIMTLKTEDHKRDSGMLVFGR